MAVFYRYAMRGARFGTEHVFERGGDVIEAHSHEVGYGHPVLCVYGVVALYLPHERYILHAGNEVAFDYTQPHRLVAWRRQTLIFNCMDENRPLDYLVRIAREGEWLCL